MFTRLRNRFRTTSIDEDENVFRDTNELRSKSRKPPNTAFRQQRLKAWQPILTPKIVLPLLLLLAILFIPMGLGFLLTSYQVQIVQIDYSQCDTLATSEFTSIPNKKYKYHFKNSKKSNAQWLYNSDTQICRVKFEVPIDIKSHIYLYYKLTNFYQNHRKYVESYDWNQLRGQAVSKDDLSSKCKPMMYRDDKIIYPCGLVANSMFNDTFSNPLNIDNNSEFSFSDKEIAWKSDLGLYKKSQYNITDIVPPENWIKKYPTGYTEDDLEALFTDERFMNWMKTAALPSFMKLYGQNKTDTMVKGTYQMDIEMNYPVSIFGGTKSVLISTSSVLGGRHLGLGICYLVVGGLAVLFMLIFVIKQLFTRKQANHSFLDGLTDGNGINNSKSTATDAESFREVL